MTPALVVMRLTNANSVGIDVMFGKETLGYGDDHLT